MSHAFYADAPFGRKRETLAARAVKPPFNPRIKDPKKAECFDEEFTEESATITPIDAVFVNQIEQSEVNGFSFVIAQGALAGDGTSCRRVIWPLAISPFVFRPLFYQVSPFIRPVFVRCCC
jgi:hypothetical protein